LGPSDTDIFSTNRDYKGFVDAPSNPDSSLDILDRAAASKGSTEDPHCDAKSHNALSGDSPNVSPPRTMTGGAVKTTQSNLSEYYPADETAQQPPLQNAQSPPPGTHHQQQQQSPHNPAVSPNNNSRQQPGRGGTRTASKSGGVQVVLDEQGSWADLGNKDGRMSNGDERNSRSGGGASSTGQGHGRPNGMLGFLTRKKGRQRSPKPMEAGVLGKEGARVVVGGR